jgi:hypothetical protein
MISARLTKDVTMLGRPLLFLSSYAPLFGLLAIRFEQRWLWISCVVLTALGVASLWLLLRLDARQSPGPHLGDEPPAGLGQSPRTRDKPEFWIACLAVLEEDGGQGPA